MFDATLSLMSMQANAPSDQELEAGAAPEIVVTLVPGLMLPLADPTDPSRPITIPGGAIRFCLDGRTAVEIGTKLVEEGRRLPRPSIVEVATSLAGVEQAAAAIQGMTSAR